MSARVDVTDTAPLEGGDLRLRIALAEKLVRFEGGNGVSEHRMVVRAFVGGHDGYAVDGGGTTGISESIDISRFESELLDYLTEWESENGDRFGESRGFKEKKHEIDESQLILVAFVQDDASRKVHQARVVELR